MSKLYKTSIPEKGNYLPLKELSIFNIVILKTNQGEKGLSVHISCINFREATKQCLFVYEAFSSRSRHLKKINTGIYLIFRGLFFEPNAEMGQKDIYGWAVNRVNKSKIITCWKAPDRESFPVHGRCAAKVNLLPNIPCLKDTFIRHIY